MANLIHNVLTQPTRSIVCIKPQHTVKECINLMAEHNIGALVICDPLGKLIGIVSERDIVFSCLHKGRDVNTTTASDIAYTKVTILSPHDDIEMAMQAMTNTKRRHVLIYEDGTLLAILSIGDVLFHILETKTREIEHLENYIAQ